MLAELMAACIDPVLYQLSRDYVGDTAETVALLWPDRRRRSASRLAAPRRGRRHALGAAPRGSVTPRSLGGLLDRLDVRGRWALLKLLGGAPRVGVSARLAKTALAEASGHDVAEIEEIWHALAPPYPDLFAWLDGRGPRPDAGGKPVFRPLMLAHPIEDDDWPGSCPRRLRRRMEMGRHPRADRGARRRRAHLLAPGRRHLGALSRDPSRPSWRKTAVLDGELLVVRDGAIAPFNDLQQRLNRKTVTRARCCATIRPTCGSTICCSTATRICARCPSPSAARGWRPGTRSITRRSPTCRALVPFDDFGELDALWRPRATPASRG